MVVSKYVESFSKFNIIYWGIPELV
jgi:hypothetical protein